MTDCAVGGMWKAAGGIPRKQNGVHERRMMVGKET